MTYSQFEEFLVDLSVDELEEFGGEVAVSGPWGSTYSFRVKVEGSKGLVGVVGELEMDDDEGVVDHIESLKLYDLSGLPKDCDEEAGSEILSEDKECELVYDRLRELLGYPSDDEIVAELLASRQQRD